MNTVNGVYSLFNECAVIRTLTVGYIKYLIILLIAKKNKNNDLGNSGNASHDGPLSEPFSYVVPKDHVDQP